MAAVFIRVKPASYFIFSKVPPGIFVRTHAILEIQNFPPKHKNWRLLKVKTYAHALPFLKQFLHKFLSSKVFSFCVLAGNFEFSNIAWVLTKIPGGTFEKIK